MAIVHPRKFIRIFALGNALIGISVLTACAVPETPSTGKSTDSSQSPDYSIVFTNDSNDSINRARRAQVSCSSSSCHPSVGMMIAALESQTGTGYYLSVCTASLIGEKLMMTSAHCIPEPIRSAGAQCSSRIHVQFPGTQERASTSVACDEIVSVSAIQPKELSVDYAFFTLAQAVEHRPFLRTNQEGIPEAAIYQAHKIDPLPPVFDSDIGRLVPRGVLQGASCQSVYQTVIAEQSDGPQSPVMVFGPCSIVQGNSGAPVVDANGEIRGLIQAKVNRESAPHGYKDIPLLEGEVEALGVASNLACVTVPGQSLSRLPESCTLATDNTATHEHALHGRKRVQGAFADLTKLTTDLSPELTWEVQAIKNPAQILSKEEFGDTEWLGMPVVKCWREPATWIQQHKGWFGLKNSSSIRVEIPAWKMTLGLDKNLKLMVKKSPLKSYSVEVKFKPAQLSEHRRSPVELRIKNDQGKEVAIQKADEIGICPEE